MSTGLNPATGLGASVCEAHYGLTQHAPSQQAIITESKSDKGKGVVDHNEPDNKQDTTIVLRGSDNEEMQPLTPGFGLTTDLPASWDEYIMNLEGPNVNVINLDDEILK